MIQTTSPTISPAGNGLRAALPGWTDANDNWVLENISPKPFVRHRHELNFAMLICGQVGVPSCAIGPPGIGKTATLEALARATQRNFFSYELSRTQPEDLQGFPVVDDYLHNGETYKYMRFVPDERLLRAGLEISLLLIDEVTNVVAAKQAPALNLLSRGIPNCWMFMAANPIEMAADGQPLTCPFINRIWYGKWEVDEEAQDYACDNYLIFPEPEFPIVPYDYMRHQPSWGALVKDYWLQVPKDRNNCPKENEKRHAPWPSSRTWTYVQRCLAAADAVKASNKVHDDIVLGLLGDTTGGAFLQHVKNLSLPDPAAILQDVGAFRLRDRYDINNAILCRVATFLRQHRNDEEAFRNALALRRVIYDQNEEMGVYFAAAIRAAMPELVTNMDIVNLTGKK